MSTCEGRGGLRRPEQSNVPHYTRPRPDPRPFDLMDVRPWVRTYTAQSLVSSLGKSLLPPQSVRESSAFRLQTHNRRRRRHPPPDRRTTADQQNTTSPRAPLSTPLPPAPRIHQNDGCCVVMDGWKGVGGCGEGGCWCGG
jgi:hypothetical protein